MGSQRWQRRLWAFLLLVLMGFGLAAPGFTQAAEKPQPLRVQLRWLPQAQFAGFYVAQDLKLFENDGLNVTLLPGGPGVNGLRRLIDGQVDVAIGWTSDALSLRRQGADLVNIAQLLQRPGTMLVCNAASGVRQPEDLKGKRIGTWFLGDQFDVGHWLRFHGLDLMMCGLFNNARLHKTCWMVELIVRQP